MPPHLPSSPDGHDPADERVSASNTDPEVNRGGADAVQKTTALGARRSANPDDDRHVAPAIPAGRGLGVAGWIAIVVVVLVLAFYLAGTM